jgi:hypothetical protein
MREFREHIVAFFSSYATAARKLKRAQILVAADAGMSDAVIAAGVSAGKSTVYRTKRRFVECNLELPLSEEWGVVGVLVHCQLTAGGGQPVLSSSMVVAAE